VRQWRPTADGHWLDLYADFTQKPAHADRQWMTVHFAVACKRASAARSAWLAICAPTSWAGAVLGAPCSVLVRCWVLCALLTGAQCWAYSRTQHVAPRGDGRARWTRT